MGKDEYGTQEIMLRIKWLLQGSHRQSPPQSVGIYPPTEEGSIKDKAWYDYVRSVIDLPLLRLQNLPSLCLPFHPSN